MKVRGFRASDTDTLYVICEATDFAVANESGRYERPRLLGDVFVGPYLELEPELAFVLDDDGNVGGYLVATADTARFSERAEHEWWPALRQRYAGATTTDGYLDEWLLRWVAQPPTVPEFAMTYPAHLHVNLLPEFRSGGRGRQLIEGLLAALRQRGVTGVHLGVNRDNVNAAGFYQHLGFREIDGTDQSKWMGLLL